MAYTNIDKPEDYFNAITWTGNASRPVSITGVGFQPDMVWAKSRSNAFNHVIYDSSRGAGQYKELTPNANWDEGGSNAHTYGYLTSFDSDGFSSTDSFDNHYFNNNGSTYVAWNWKANGGTTSSNSDGSVTSTVQVNQDAGFSIVTWTTGVGAGNHSVGHGLGVKPAMFITKSRGSTSSWWTWHQDLGDTSYVNLQANTAKATYSTIWGGGITSSVFGYNYPTTVYANQPYIAYCFAEKQGYSKFGSYVGNGNTDGAFVYTGFKPAWVLIKRSDGVTNWRLFDNKRSGYNKDTSQLYPNLTNAEDSAGDQLELLSNGFKNRTVSGDQNGSGNNYIYMAFAENPFTTSTGIPTTAR